VADTLEAEHLLVEGGGLLGVGDGEREMADLCQGGFLSRVRGVGVGENGIP
jgi:hypothetical protein